MDFDLSEDQLALQQAAAALLETRATPARVRAVAGGDDPVDRALWSDMAAQGWLGVTRSIDDGGLGLDLVEVAVLGEQLGRHVAPVPFLGTVLAIGALDQAGDDDAGGLGGLAASVWAERLAGGDAVGAVAWSRRADAVRAERRDGGAWRLRGRTDPVVFAPVADVAIVPAVADGEPGLYAVALEPDERPDVTPAMDVTRVVGRYVLEDRPARRLGGADAVEAFLDRAVAALCAEMLGSADRVLEMAVQYAKDRVQFGRPIGSFQAVKHRCADMLVDVEGMRSAAYYAAWSVGAGEADALGAASAAKIWCSDAAARVMGSGLQVHGGIGFTWEHDLHLYLKRSQLDQVSFGDARWHRDRLAAWLRPRAEAGLPVL